MSIGLRTVFMQVEVKKRLDLPEEEDEEGEWDLETEILGQKGNIYRGFNILDETTNVIVSDPSERVLRAMVHPEHSAEGLSLEKVSVTPLPSLVMLLLKHLERRRRGGISRALLDYIRESCYCWGVSEGYC